MKERPVAKYEYVDPFGDGRCGTHQIRYYCPKCGRLIEKKQVGCDKCEIFFDWSKEAHVKTITTIEWE